uniref:J domain-containing protein n=2 Tax=Macrostomum lignano TaxID=282301 RepID=A0A1I8IHC9_9PLAT
SFQPCTASQQSFSKLSAQSRQSQMSDPDGDTDLAEKVKAEGNALFAQKKYTDAIRCYDRAIELSSRVASYYGNRAAAYIMLSRYHDALKDCRTSVSIDSNFLKGYLRLGKVLLNLGEFSESVIAFQKALVLDSSCHEAEQQLLMLKDIEDQLSSVEKRLSGGDARTALYHLDRCLQSAPHSTRLRLRRAELLIELGRHDEAAMLTTDLVRLDSSGPEVASELLLLRGLSLYYQEMHEKAQQHFAQALKMNPDCEKAKAAFKRSKRLAAAKDEANSLIKERNYEAACTAYTNALLIDPKHDAYNAKVHCNRALSLLHLDRLQEALEDCQAALNLQPDYANAMKRLAQVQQRLEQFEEAVKTCEELQRRHPSRENRAFLQEAQLALKKSKRKCYYKILGVGQTASDDEIKRAYKKKALLHHPDRHSSATEEQKRAEETAFKDVGEAYSVLTDPQKRRRYDAGEDLEDMQQGGAGGFNGMDPNQIFAQFFGGGGGGGFPSFHQQQHFHGGHHRGGGAGGMPGFSFSFG